jgi:pimeloyl-ACP methyl ester carboxylesterase
LYPAETAILNLPDGRSLACDVHGPGDGYPVFYFHGAPSARNEVDFFGLPGIASDVGIRLIAPDRPGLGGSSFQQDRRILDWPADVVAIADYLGVERFSVLGYSGGGPYALACAQQIPERLASVVLVSSTGPHEVGGLTDNINSSSLRFMQLCANRPVLGALASRSMGFMARRFPGRLIAGAVSSLPEPDARLMSDPEIGLKFARLVSEAARNGGRGPQHDTALMVRPWGLDLGSISLPVQIWHGEEDRNAPVVMGQWLAKQLPDARLHLFPGEGHLSLFAHHASEILRGSIPPGAMSS